MVTLYAPVTGSVPAAGTVPVRVITPVDLFIDIAIAPGRSPRS